MRSALAHLRGGLLLALALGGMSIGLVGGCTTDVSTDPRYAHVVGAPTRLSREMTLWGSDEPIRSDLVQCGMSSANTASWGDAKLIARLPKETAVTVISIHRRVFLISRGPLLVATVAGALPTDAARQFHATVRLGYESDDFSETLEMRGLAPAQEP